MKKVSDATQNPSAGPGGGWFRIAEEGLNNGMSACHQLLLSVADFKAFRQVGCRYCGMSVHNSLCLDGRRTLRSLLKIYLQIAAGGIQKATIPACIENGDYLLRFELLALHSAYNQGGAQFYVGAKDYSVTAPC